MITKRLIEVPVSRHSTTNCTKLSGRSLDIRAAYRNVFGAINSLA
ncbi:hypothetical protein N644_1328 [Lactiplantibacillus paraplantarum]|nr:hypothetical protein N644_1328 [Lactiplantibacillus paraplantarum]